MRPGIQGQGQVYRARARYTGPVPAWTQCTSAGMDPVYQCRHGQCTRSSAGMARSSAGMASTRSSAGMDQVYQCRHGPGVPVPDGDNVLVSATASTRTLSLLGL